MQILKLTKITALSIALLMPLSVQATSDVVSADLVALLAEANPDKGKKGLRTCTACHTFDLGGKKKSGPNLYDIINKKIGAVEGYRYSKALKALNADGKVWGYGELFAFLKKPKAYAKGTKMGFGGIKKDSKNADLIAYLRTLSENPVPLPE